MKIVEIAVTAYPVTDIQRARAFYEQVLELQPTRSFGEGDKLWIEYDIGPTTFAISNMAPDWKPSPDGPSVAFEVEDFDQAVKQLKEKGAKLRMEPFATPVCRILLIEDPDGNGITIHKRHPDAS